MAGYISIQGSAPKITYTEDQLIEMVKLRMDELDPEISMLADVGIKNNKPVTGSVDALLNESRLDVLKNADISLIPKVKATIAQSSLSVQDGHAVMTAPEDMLRVVSVGCSSWKRTVTKFYGTDSKEYSRQQYEYARSTVKNPVVIFFDGSTYGLFPYTSGDTVELVYVSSLTGFDSLSEQMINALCWDCAAKVLSTLGMADYASRAMEIYGSIIK